MNEIDEIRQEMARIRHDLHEDVTGVVGGASEAMNWRSYWRAHPWLTSGLVVLAGYLLVPKRTKEVEIVRVPTPVPAPAASSNSETAAWDQAAPRRGPLSLWPIMRWALGIAGPLALNAAQSYASVWIENQLGTRPKDADGSDGDRRRDRGGPVSPDDGRGGPSVSTRHRSDRG